MSARYQPGPGSGHGVVAAPPSGTEPGEPVRGLEARLERLEAHARDLARDRELVRPRASAPERPRAEVSEDALVEALADLERRVSALERRQSEGSGHERSDPSSPEEFDELRRRAQLVRRDMARRRVLDWQAADPVRAQAWLDLARMDSEPWTDAVVAAAIGIGANSDDDRAREVIWIGADSRHHNELLVRPLIAALSDPVANVREEAADALGRYLDVAGVRGALLWSSRNDSSEKVRSEAARVLRGEDG